MAAATQDGGSLNALRVRSCGRIKCYCVPRVAARAVRAQWHRYEVSIHELTFVMRILCNIYFFREVYGFLENALTGQPQKKLNAASEAFLSREIEVEYNYVIYIILY